MLISQLPVWAETSTKGLPLSLGPANARRYLQTLFGLRCNALHMCHFCQNVPDIVPHVAARFYAVSDIRAGRLPYSICQFMFTGEAAHMHGDAGEFCAEQSKSFEDPNKRQRQRSLYIIFIRHAA